MRRSPASCRPSVSRSPCPSWVGCITNISEREFPTGTPSQLTDSVGCPV
jgi:hypothetical protein